MTDIIDTARLFKFENIARDENLVFVVMPFHSKYFELFDKVIKPVINDKNLVCIKADDPKTNNAIIKDIIEYIYKSRFVIADITETNSNVMYEIGVADAISREVILINERLDEGIQHYPFDINYRRIHGYDNTAAGGQDFRKLLGEAIDLVLIKTAETYKKAETLPVEIGKLDELLRHSRMNFRLRTRRIEWFTHHPIHFLAGFAKFHSEMIKELEQLHIKFSSEKFEITKRRCAAYIPNPEYIKSFILTELNDTKDFISNAWLVNKFPDELASFGLGSTLVNYLPTLSDVEFEFKFDDIIEGINFNLERLNFYISAMQDERAEIGLPIINLDKYSLPSSVNE